MSYLSNTLGLQVPSVIADYLTAKHSGFSTFFELVNAQGAYRPSMDMRDVELLWLANYYDAYQQEHDDERRVYRFAAGTKEGAAAARELKQLRINAKLDEPEAASVRLGLADLSSPGREVTHA